jgi:hypothetical protein
MNIQDERRVTDILEDLMIEEATKEMQRSIDFEVLCGLYVEMGHTVVRINYGPTCQWIDVIAWVDANRTGNYREHKGTWVFELPEDATMFALRWV